MKVVENSPQNARNYTIFKNFLGEACPQTPLAKARSFAARDMPLRGMYIQNQKKLKLGPPPEKSCIRPCIVHVICMRAICMRCHMHALPYACVAICMRCHMHALPYACVAICMRCHMHALPYACVAISMRCHMHALPYACVAICMRCHMHVMPWWAN